MLNRMLIVLLALIVLVQMQPTDPESSVDDVDNSFPCDDPYIICNEANETYKVCGVVFMGGIKRRTFITKAWYNCSEGYLCNDVTDNGEVPCMKDPSVTTQAACPEITTTKVPTTATPTTLPPTTTTEPEVCDKPDCVSIATAGFHCGHLGGQYYECAYVWWWWETSLYECTQCPTQECKDLSSCKVAV